MCAPSAAQHSMAPANAPSGRQALLRHAGDACKLCGAHLPAARRSARPPGPAPLGTASPRALGSSTLAHSIFAAAVVGACGRSTKHLSTSRGPSVGHVQRLQRRPVGLEGSVMCGRGPRNAGGEDGE